MLSCGPLLTVGNISGPLYAADTSVYLKEQNPFFSTLSALLRLSLQAAALTHVNVLVFVVMQGERPEGEARTEGLRA